MVRVASGINELRRQQLISATLAVIERGGMQSATVGEICRESGLSVGIVSHYFRGKQGLLEATMRYLLQALRRDLMLKLDSAPEHLTRNDPRQRLTAIIEANFTGVQTDNGAALAWVAFWAQTPHNEAMARLQRINERRLLSNLVYALRMLIPPAAARDTAQTLAALIDGFWLRAALSQGRIETETAVRLCHDYLDSQLSAYQRGQTELADSTTGEA